MSLGALLLLAAVLWTWEEARRPAHRPPETSAPATSPEAFPGARPDRRSRQKLIATLPVSLGRVVHIADGDTISLEGGHTVRYLGIDTPEHGEPYFEEAKAENLRFVGGRVVELKAGGPETMDRYQRLLALVFLKPKTGDGQALCVNFELVREGLAFVYRESLHSLNDSTLDALLAAQRTALAGRKGMWDGRLSRAKSSGETFVATKLHIHRQSCPLLEAKARMPVPSLEDELLAGKSPCRKCQPLP